MKRPSQLPSGQTTTDLLANALRNAIVQGRFSEGEDLTQEEIASQYGVSRVPLREAMRRLEAEGLITFLANRGAFVTELSPENIQEIYELRMLIEGDLLYRSVRNITANDLRKAEAVHKNLEDAENQEEQDELNRAFHSLLYAPANRPRQQAIVENLRNLVERYRNINRSLLASTHRFQTDHKRILQACRQGDPRKARSLLVRHLDHAMRIALKHLRKDQL